MDLIHRGLAGTKGGPQHLDLDVDSGSGPSPTSVPKTRRGVTRSIWPIYDMNDMGDLVPYQGNDGRSQFERLLELRFPAIAAEIDDCERGLLHSEMAVFARGTCAAIEGGDFEQMQAHLDFVDELFGSAAPDLENAICVSYLENVFLGSETERYTAARRMLSDRLRTALGELEDHWRKIVNSSKDRKSQ
ncbi:DUF7674 family protein [Paludibaculum fermentans]|uniref:DUF7674 family protein n=1 Tax=Paludibaculum fermentans TaxID=1473598 RepID=UPI003EBDC01F